MRLPCIVLAGSLLVLSACADQRQAQAPANPAPTPTLAPVLVPPIDLLGTWCDPAGGGFLAIGARQVVIALDGTDRQAAAPVEIAIEPGMGAGRLGLAGGTVLYLARGGSQLEGVPVEHLDAEIIDRAGRSLRRRLIAEAGLRLASRLAAPSVPAAAPPALPGGPDADFLAAVPATRLPAAQRLVERSRAGGSGADLATAFGGLQRDALVAVLELIAEARRLPPDRAAGRLEEADRARAEAETFARAWRTWMAGRG